MSEQETIKIVIPVEEEPPAKAERPSSGPATTAYDATRKVAGLAKDAAQRAAQSEAGRKAAGKLGEVADRGVRYVGTHMADTAEQQGRQAAEAFQQRLKQTDWEKEARSGVASGLQWLSGRLDRLSVRFSAEETPKEGPADKDQPGPE